jgi:leader peptidase (prepilin peptidase)/N-methyltransferase
VNPVLLASLALAIGVTATPTVTHLADACSHTVPRYTRAERAARAVGVAAALSAAIWVGLARLGPVRTAVAVPLLVLGAAAVLVDLRERRLPDRLTIGLLAATAAAVGTSCATAGDVDAAGRAVGGAVLAAGVLLVGKLASSRAVGWGDVKFAPALGAHLGWAGWPVFFSGLLAWWVLVLVTVGATVAVRAVDPRRAQEVVPFGPAMLLGTLFALLT